MALRKLGYKDGFSGFGMSVFQPSGLRDPVSSQASFSIFPTSSDVDAEEETVSDDSGDGGDEGDGIFGDFDPNIEGILEGFTEAFTRRGTGRLLDEIGLGADQESRVPSRSPSEEQTEFLTVPGPGMAGSLFAWILIFAGIVTTVGLLLSD